MDTSKFTIILVSFLSSLVLSTSAKRCLKECEATDSDNGTCCKDAFLQTYNQLDVDPVNIKAQNRSYHLEGRTNPVNISAFNVTVTGFKTVNISEAWCNKTDSKYNFTITKVTVIGYFNSTCNTTHKFVATASEITGDLTLSINNTNPATVKNCTTNLVFGNYEFEIEGAPDQIDDVFAYAISKNADREAIAKDCASLLDKKLIAEFNRVFAADSCP